MKFIAHILLLLTLTNLAFAQSLDDQFSEPTGLTDQQVQDSKDFVHQGVKDRTMKEGCDKSKGACEGPKDGFQLEEMISAAYAAAGLIPGFAKLTKKAEKPATGGDTKPNSTPPAESANGEAGKKAEKDTTTDYCTYVAMGGEMVGKYMQTSFQKKAEESTLNIEDVQIKSLETVRQSHLARRKTSTYQASLYTGVTACYGMMLWKGGAALDWKLMAKMGGSATLATLYGLKIAKHNKAAKSVETVINDMKSSDKCDPWSRTPCFCKEASSKELYPIQYEEVCVLNNGDFDTPKVAMACVTQKGDTYEEDPNCKCKLTNTCVRNLFKGMKSVFNGGTNLLNDANNNLDAVMAGNFDSAAIEKANLKNLALANKLMPKLPAKALSKKQSSKQESLAKALGEHMPESTARLVSGASRGDTSSYSGGISDSATNSGLSPELEQKISNVEKPLEYEKGKSKSQKASAEPEFTMPKFPGFGDEAKDESGGTEVLSFAEQAVSKADVSNAPETPIFDIISNRYRRSWEKFEPASEKK